MNLTRVLQPYVCCLGNPVAGNPTQFVMYRAARAAGVDWRFFTSQVEIDQFEIAFRGVQALGLRGMALFDPFQSKSLDLLDSVTESAMCLGRVNVARLDGNSWLGDNTFGLAIVNCIRPLLAPTRAADSMESPDVTDHQTPCVLVVGANEVAKSMRLANEEISERIFAVPSELEVDSMGADEGAVITSKASLELASIDEFVQSKRMVDSLILGEIPSAVLARQLSTIPWSRSPSCLILGNATEKQIRLWKDAIKVPNLNHIDMVDLLAHQAAADFQFWTGVSPMIEPIRDSLEEYLQW
jgi:shikimate dehydrogenase